MNGDNDTGELEVRPSDGDYLVRAVEPALAQLLEAVPTIRIRGPRGVGKTTTARRFARRVIDLSDSRQREAAINGGTALLAEGPHPTLIDEWQEAPEVVWSAKRVVDAGRKPGLFIVAGSVEHAQAPDERWPLLTRGLDVRMVPLSVAERMGQPENVLLGRLFDALPRTGTTSDLTMGDYADLLLSGGYPSWSSAPAGVRRHVYDEILAAGEIVGSAHKTDRVRFRRFLVKSLVRTAQFSDRRKLARESDVAESTADRYQEVFHNAGLIYAVDVWRPDALSRVRRKPKLFAVDSGLAAAAMGMTAERVPLDHQARGALVETFVAMQLRAGVEAEPGKYELWCFSGHQREVDFIVEERRTGRCLAIEVKAGPGPTERDARHIAWLAQQLADRGQRECQLVGGLVLHTGPYAYPLNRPWNEPEEPLFREPLIMAAPISVLWDG